MYEVITHKSLVNRFPQYLINKNIYILKIFADDTLNFTEMNSHFSLCPGWEKKCHSNWCCLPSKWNFLSKTGLHRSQDRDTWSILETKWACQDIALSGIPFLKKIFKCNLVYCLRHWRQVSERTWMNSEHLLSFLH